MNILYYMWAYNAGVSTHEYNERNILVCRMLYTIEPHYSWMVLNTKIQFMSKSYVPIKYTYKKM